MRVHLVDGTYELFRNWFGAPRAVAPDRREVGATIGLLRSLAAMLRDPQVTHIGVAFDSTVESFRNRLWSGYKSSEGIEPELLAQFPLAERAARALGITTWGMVEFEADDALATMADRCARATAVAQVLLCTPDKDLAQCVRGTRVVQFDRMHGVLIDEDGVNGKFGVPPPSIPDWLALVGDAADGLPGVPRWGRKSASLLLARYRTIAAIPAHPSEWEVKVRGAAGLSSSLEQHRDAAALWRELATLRTDVPIAESPEELRWRGVPASELEVLCAELGTRAPQLARR